MDSSEDMLDFEDDEEIEEHSIGAEEEDELLASDAEEEGHFSIQTSKEEESEDILDVANDVQFDGEETVVEDDSARQRTAFVSHGQKDSGSAARGGRYQTIPVHSVKTESSAPQTSTHAAFRRPGGQNGFRNRGGFRGRARGGGGYPRPSFVRRQSVPPSQFRPSYQHQAIKHEPWMGQRPPFEAGGLYNQQLPPTYNASVIAQSSVAFNRPPFRERSLPTMLDGRVANEMVRIPPQRIGPVAAYQQQQQQKSLLGSGMGPSVPNMNLQSVPGNSRQWPTHDNPGFRMHSNDNMPLQLDVAPMDDLRSALSRNPPPPLPTTAYERQSITRQISNPPPDFSRHPPEVRRQDFGGSGPQGLPLPPLRQVSTDYYGDQQVQATSPARLQQPPPPGNWNSFSRPEYQQFPSPEESGGNYYPPPRAGGLRPQEPPSPLARNRLTQPVRPFVVDQNPGNFTSGYPGLSLVEQQQSIKQLGQGQVRGRGRGRGRGVMKRRAPPPANQPGVPKIKQERKGSVFSRIAPKNARNVQPGNLRVVPTVEDTKPVIPVAQVKVEPLEFDDPDYMQKIELQKKKRARLLQLKEERRKNAAYQKGLELEMKSVSGDPGQTSEKKVVQVNQVQVSPVCTKPPIPGLSGRGGRGAGRGVAVQQRGRGIMRQERGRGGKQVIRLNRSNIQTRGRGTTLRGNGRAELADRDFVGQQQNILHEDELNVGRNVAKTAPANAQVVGRVAVTKRRFKIITKKRNGVVISRTKVPIGEDETTVEENKPPGRVVVLSKKPQAQTIKRTISVGDPGISENSEQAINKTNLRASRRVVPSGLTVTTEYGAKPGNKGTVVLVENLATSTKATTIAKLAEPAGPVVNVQLRSDNKAVVSFLHSEGAAKFVSQNQNRLVGLSVIKLSYLN